MYNEDLFHLCKVSYTFYLFKDKIQYRYDHLFAHRPSLHNHTLINCRFNMDRKQNKCPADSGGGGGGGGYMLNRHNLVVARNTTLEAVSCKVNEYYVSENTLYRFVDGFYQDRISFFSQPTIWETIFCSDKMKHILTREHWVHDEWFCMKNITRDVGI